MPAPRSVCVPPAHPGRRPAEDGDHFFADAAVGFQGVQMPVGGTAGQKFHEAEAQPLHLTAEGRQQRLFGLPDVLHAVQGAAFGIGHSGQPAHDLAHVDGPALAQQMTAQRRGGGLLAQQGGGGHLAAGHAVNGVVDEDRGDVLAAIGGMYGLRQTDGRHVPVPLIGEDDAFRPGAADARAHGAGPPVRSFHGVHVEIIVTEGRTAHRGHEDGPFRKAQLVQRFAHQTVGDAVMTAGA